MASTLLTENMFNLLSEESNCWLNPLQIRDCQVYPDKKPDNLYKIGNKKNGDTKYIVYNSYVSEQEKILTKAFTNMSDKNRVAEKLLCTKACNFALKNPDTGKYGSCYRSTCTFAHSLEELNDPMCEFDEACRYKKGRYNKNGTFDDTLKCTFRHTSETREEWLERTGKTLPDLPKTLSKTVTKKVLGSGYANKTPPFTPPKRIVLEIPSAPVKPPANKVVKKEYIDKVKKNLTKEYNEKSKKKSKKKSLNSNKDLHIIKVPSKELAEIAIKVAFDNKVFNIQVIIEE